MRFPHKQTNLLYLKLLFSWIDKGKRICPRHYHHPPVNTYHAFFVQATRNKLIKFQQWQHLKHFSTLSRKNQYVNAVARLPEGSARNDKNNYYIVKRTRGCWQTRARWQTATHGGACRPQATVLHSPPCCTEGLVSSLTNQARPNF